MKNQAPQLIAVGLTIFAIITVVAFNSNSTDSDVLGTSSNNLENETEMTAANNTNPNADKFNKYSSAPEILDAPERTNKKSVLETEKGTIEIELFGDVAPLAVSNHIFLVSEKFYDTLTFHRREEGFVIQGGDPLGEGYGGPGYKFEDEPVTKEYNRGIVAMANSGPNTNGSQFFIMLDDVPLPPQYTIFGEVISGIEVIDEIQVGDKILKATIESL